MCNCAFSNLFAGIFGDTRNQRDDKTCAHLISGG
jgi:hypothetical protein